ncbi:MAG: hypothetical protein AYK19_14655 [Theionarchaea archaeon DG-70-1]|nr:MAG: hypothetical protein AYK19_14655 [Theionarchaea archaeon DG-70-1]
MKNSAQAAEHVKSCVPYPYSMKAARKNQLLELYNHHRDLRYQSVTSVGNAKRCVRKVPYTQKVLLSKLTAAGAQDATSVWTPVLQEFYSPIQRLLNPSSASSVNSVWSHAR